MQSSIAVMLYVKKNTSLTAVINENKKPVLVFKNSNYSKENNTIHTLPHET